MADAAAGVEPRRSVQVASLADALAEFAARSESERHAIAFAARLRNTGALGNPALAKGADLPPRAAAMQLADIPADGARICERIRALPPMTADFIRWQSEAWDGTGFPDQLRWHGIPHGAQFLRLASAYVEDEDAEESFGAILRQSGRLFGPDQTRTFIMWYHTNAGDIDERAMPVGALDANETHVSEILQLLGERVDAHNGTPGRWQRVGHRAERIAEIMELSNEHRNTLALAALFFGIGELRARELEATQFDPLSRLGVDLRAKHAAKAADIVAEFPTFSGLADILRARAEWYDGTGKPQRLRHDQIPVPSQVLAVAIAYDALEEAYHTHIGGARHPSIDRLEEAAGTQFDPRVVRAMAAVARTHV